jgi:hypothetical protein
MSINQLDAITVDVVEAARETLVIGTSPRQQIRGTPPNRSALYSLRPTGHRWVLRDRQPGPAADCRAR